MKAYCIETLEGSEAAREAWEEAVEALEEELRENSENLVAWERLKSIYSVALKDRKRIQRPIRKLVELMPKNPWCRWNLANLHYERGEFEEALEELEQALSDAPPDKRRVTILKTRAGILLTLRRYEESTATQRRVIEWVNEDPYAHWNLGISFCYGGRLAEGVSEFARAQELGLQLLPHLIEYRAMMERMLALEPDLDRILKGEREPADTAELELFADFLMLKREDLAAARLYRRLFPQSPASRSGCRYDAAATAAVGGDEELSPLDAAQRAEWRHWALELLEEELSARKPVLTDPVGRARTRGEVVAWFYDPRWSGYRTEPALLRLPKEEREAWRNLWADIRDAIE